MLFKKSKKFKGSLVLASAPTKAKTTDESPALAEKYAAQVKWMEQKGISGCLQATPRRDAKRTGGAKLTLVGNETPNQDPETPAPEPRATVQQR